MSVCHIGKQNKMNEWSEVVNQFNSPDSWAFSFHLQAVASNSNSNIAQQQHVDK